MFGQNNQDHHDDKPQDDVLSAPAVQGLLDDHHDNPALPSSDADQPVPAAAVAPVDDTPAAPVVAPAADGDLLSIKQQALTALSPLVDHLDQTPEEKFRTTMMMIQASDNQGLIKVAYEAAQSINDEKVKAQALLDIVNEINYFTQQQH